MGSPTNYAPHDRPQQQGSAHPTAERSPIAHKEKTTPRDVRSVVFVLYPVRDSNPCYRRERPAS